MASRAQRTPCATRQRVSHALIVVYREQGRQAGGERERGARTGRGKEARAVLIVGLEVCMRCRCRRWGQQTRGNYGEDNRTVVISNHGQDNKNRGNYGEGKIRLNESNRGTRVQIYSTESGDSSGGRRRRLWQDHTIP